MQKLNKDITTLETPEFWLKLCPEMTIGTNQPSAFGQCTIDSPSSSKYQSQLLNEGYFKANQTADMQLIARLKNAIETLDTNGILPVFITLFDEYWALVKQLSPILELSLGKQFQWMPDVWAWNIKANTRGWPPHRDRTDPCLRPDGSPQSVTMWVSITEATPENGCMYIVPAQWDKYYPNGPSMKIDDIQSIRALPTNPGDVLVWNQAVLHWGGRSSETANTPRISIAIEAQRSDIPAYRTPLLNPQNTVPFEKRLGIIGRQLLHYQHMYRLDEYHWNLGERWSQLLPEVIKTL
jgi:ectoine hydroxylase-related dioxygenase (phytanoyl-CoA dioxygenase family)